MAPQTESSTKAAPTNAQQRTSLQEFSQLAAKSGPADLLEVRYRGKTLWRPGEPELSGAEYKRRTSSIDRELDLQESDKRTESLLADLDQA